MSFMKSWSSLSVASAFTSWPRASAMSVVSWAMSDSRVSMASLFNFILSSRSPMIFSRFALFFSHSSTSSCFSARNSTRRLFKVSMMPCEWKAYVGSSGSTFAPVCKSVPTAFWSALETRFIARARARLAEMLWMSEASTGLDFSIASMADSSEEIALLRSAAAASYSARAFSKRASVSASSAAMASWLACLSFSSASLASFKAVSSWIVLDNSLMLSRPLRMASDLLEVMDWHQQEKVL
mmetsp:Transcript_1065/g.2188  ORF Transcript_1065/g.2188 Transcript_1065/m.2188 type:complete len:240 (-) Transcript_1065:128-847(-)